jgi:cell division protease FtsH
VFLGRDFQQNDGYSELTAQTVDAEVRRIVTEQHTRARGLIEEQLENLHAIANALLEVETISGKDIQDLMDGKPLERKLKKPREDETTGAGKSEERKPEKRPGLFPPLGKKEPDPEPA